MARTRNVISIWNILTHQTLWPQIDHGIQDWKNMHESEVGVLIIASLDSESCFPLRIPSHLDTCPLKTPVVGKVLIRPTRIAILNRRRIALQQTLRLRTGTNSFHSRHDLVGNPCACQGSFAWRPVGVGAVPHARLVRIDAFPKKAMVGKWEIEWKHVHEKKSNVENVGR